VRYEYERPGDLLHVDTKKLGRIVGGPGHRATGDRTRRSRGVGWEVLHVAIDDASRLVYAEILPDETGTTAAAFVERAVAWFAEQGVVVRRILSDNGSPYVSRAFAAALRNLGIRHSRTRPYRPRTNGKDVHLCQAASSARSTLKRVPARSIVQSTRSCVRASAMMA
jgi:transposase InsO family protein